MGAPGAKRAEPNGATPRSGKSGAGGAVAYFYGAAKTELRALREIRNLERSSEVPNRPVVYVDVEAHIHVHTFTL